MRCKRTACAVGLAGLVMLAAVGCRQYTGNPPERAVYRARHDEEPNFRGTSGTQVRVDLEVCTQECAFDRARCNHGEACGCRGMCGGRCGGAVAAPRSSDLVPGGPAPR